MYLYIFSYIHGQRIILELAITIPAGLIVHSLRNIIKMKIKMRVEMEIEINLPAVGGTV